MRHPNHFVIRAVRWSAVLACALLAHAGEAIAQGPVTLGAGHLGVPLTAPAAPVLSEASNITYTWQRCSFYTTMVQADGATHLWPLSDASATAADVVGSAPGRYRSTNRAPRGRWSTGAPRR